MRASDPISSGARSGSRRLALWLLTAALVGAVSVTPVGAQEAPPPEPPPESPPAAIVAEGDLLPRLEEAFRIIRLRNGVLLEPRAESGFTSVELSPEGLAVDGREVDAAELRELLGASADPVLELAALDESARRELFREADAGALEVSAPVAPAPPEPPDRTTRPRRPRGDDSEVVVGSDLVVEEGEVARDVVVFGGDLRIRGEVVGDAVAIGGSAWVDGPVSGDLAVIGGTAHLGQEAEIRGDAVSVGGRIEMSEGSEVYGEVVEVPFGPSFRFGWPRAGQHWRWWQDRHDWFDISPFGWGLALFWKLVGFGLVFLLACLALLLARNPVERIGKRVSIEPWKAGLVGLVTQILFFPLVILVVVILLISIIGIPLLLLVPFALLGALLIAFLGYVAVAYRIGRWTESRFGWSLANPYLALLVGLALVQVWSFCGDLLAHAGGPIWFFAIMFLIFGAVVKYVTWTVGLGGALLTRFGTADGWERGAALPPPPPAGTPPAEAPGAEGPFWEAEPAPPAELPAEADEPHEPDTRPIEPEPPPEREPE